LISIKKYLDRNAPAVSAEEPETSELLTVTMESYRAVLRTVGRSAVAACPAPGRELERDLASLEQRLVPGATTTEAVKKIQERVEYSLERWGTATAEHLKGKTDEVKELLIMLARTAEAIGERDQRYASQFGGLTAELQAIANLDDISQVRASVAKKAAELKSCVDQMAQDGQHSLAALRSKVSVYESKLEVVEELASKDTLTGLANRRGVETRMEWGIKLGRTFCVVMLDLNLFKRVNDKHGHVAGDDLLKKFAEELKKNVRNDDLVGRWGGDEFIIVLNRDLKGGVSQVQRIREWVFGDYMIETGAGKSAVKIPVVASIGLAQWEPGKTVKQLVEEADAAMYLDKKESMKKK
jgi:diguanylate cyclase (GGDEF)-like protein